MKVNELDLHDKFRFKGHHYTIMKAVPRHKDVWDCMDEEGRHVPFRGDVEVDEDQRRITNGIPKIQLPYTCDSSFDLPDTQIHLVGR